MKREQTVSWTIKNWAEDDRPREKMLNKGRRALSDAELLAILIGSGNVDENAVTLCRRILSESKNNLGELSKKSVEQLTAYKGIGMAKAISIVAALELGRRRRREQAMALTKISSSACVFDLMQPLVGDLPHEEFWIVYLNNWNKVIDSFCLSKGGMTGTLVDVRLVLKRAIEVRATGMILCHNHPSGNLAPSGADKQLTKKIQAAGENLDIKVLDHLIITEKSYFSFADESLL